MSALKSDPPENEAPPQASRTRPRRLADRVFAETGLPAVAVGLVLCAVLAPIVALRASVWAGRAASADQSRLADTGLAGTRFSQDVARVNQDVVTFGRYLELEAGVLVLYRQAQAAKADGDDALAARLYRTAQENRSIAAGLRQMLETAGLRTTSGRAPDFSYQSALRAELRADEEYQVAVRAPAAPAARVAHDATIDVTGVAIIWAAGLVLFTLAQIAEPESGARAVFGVTGLGTVVAAIPLTLLTW
jgi:hypothetical protein